MTITLLIGGARSGKSALAVARALDWQRNDVCRTGLQAQARLSGEVPVGRGEGGPDDAHFFGDRSVVFVATGSGGDDEMADRIGRHKAERPASWETVEAPLDLVAGLRVASCLSLPGSPRGICEPGEPALIIDCLSMWVANHLMPSMSSSSSVASSPSMPLLDQATAEAELHRQIQECFVYLRSRAAPTWFVTNEVGMGLVPMNILGRHYRDVLGRVNAAVSLLADEAFLTVAGRIVRLDRP